MENKEEEQILKKLGITDLVGSSLRALIIKAMKKHTSQSLSSPELKSANGEKEAIEFSDWINDNYEAHDKEGNPLLAGQWRQHGSQILTTTKELYQEFLKEKL